MPSPTCAHADTLLRVSYGEPQRLGPNGWVRLDLRRLAVDTTPDAPVWGWLASHGVARPSDTITYPTTT